MTKLSEIWTTEAQWTVPPGWRQGRGAWGGLVVGQVVTAASHDLPDSRLIPRSVWVSMLGPVKAGQVSCTVVDLRAGKATLAREVNLHNADGALLTRAVVVFGITRDPTAVSSPPSAPVTPGPPADFVELGPPLAPEFTAKLRFAPVVGMPYSGTTELLSTGWVGLPAGAEEPLTPALVAAFSDAWWTTSIVGLDGATMTAGPPPVATLDFVMSFPEPIDAAEDVWSSGLWHTGRVIGGSDGYLTEIRTLHSPAGRLLASNTQMQAIGATSSQAH